MRQREVKYQFLVNWIKEKIESGELRPGEKMYSENELSEMLGLSRQTVRRAIGILEEEGLVERIRGSGTYIGRQNRDARKRTMNIAVISTYVDRYIFPSTLEGIARTLSGAGYMTQIAFTNNRVDEERRILEGILEKDNVDGVIVEATKGRCQARTSRITGNFRSARWLFCSSTADTRSWRRLSWPSMISGSRRTPWTI